jgi:hypothetical protein
VAVRQHQRLDPELVHFEPDPLEFLGLDLAGKLHAMNGNRAERRGRALGPHLVQRVAVDRDQLRAHLGAGGGQALGCRRSVQPGVKTEAVAGHEVLGQPVFRRRIGQRLDMPGLAVDLLGGLQRIAAIDENGRLAGQDDRHAGRAGEAGQPGQPLFGGRDILVLLLIGAGNHEPGQLPPRQLLAKDAKPRGQRDAALGFFECLEMSFEHRRVTLEFGGAVRNPAELATIWHNPCFNISVRVSRIERFCGAGCSAQDIREAPGVFQLNEEGMHHACFHV